ncbi:beta-ketoacyl synthase N-terminal-like domain-containing protein [Caldalkalibacillus salinus]|uniref:beta-ketoacyl synthase N-terminal-like domain-containing protein n=1 Tax=Caldalkalibacillus salinus TaxID=2803787 RepID=UPI0019240629|nr:beta-ketoacyl synthase N-terminal-like domain-containing protein [Caldalkalibacillus salinus]
MNEVVITGGAILLDTYRHTMDECYPIKKVGDISYADFIGTRGLKYLTESTKMSLTASVMAKAHAELEEVEPERGGVVLATNMASISYVTDFDMTSLVEGVNDVSPMQGPNLLLNAPASRLGIFHRFSGFNTTVTSGRVGGHDALEYAYQAIARDEVDVCIVAGVEEKSEEYLNWHIQSGRIKQHETDLINQGAAVVILESKTHALQRGATIYGTLSGFASYFDPNALREQTEQVSVSGYQHLMDTLFSPVHEVAATQDVYSSNSSQQAHSSDISTIKSVCIADSQLHRSGEEEKAFILNHLGTGPLVINHFERFGGELYGACGILQLLTALHQTEEGHGLIFNYDWFGHYRSLLFHKEGE